VRVYHRQAGPAAVADALMAGLAILKHIMTFPTRLGAIAGGEHRYSSTSAGARSSSNMRGIDRSSADALEPADGEEKLQAMLQESLAVATRKGGGGRGGESNEAVRLARVVIDTTVQPKAVMFPPTPSCSTGATKRLVTWLRSWGEPAPIYRRVGKMARIKHQATPTPISSSAQTRVGASSRPIWRRHTRKSSGT